MCISVYYVVYFSSKNYFDYIQQEIKGKSNGS